MRFTSFVDKRPICAICDICAIHMPLIMLTFRHIHAITRFVYSWRHGRISYSKNLICRRCFYWPISACMLWCKNFYCQTLEVELRIIIFKLIFFETLPWPHTHFHNHYCDNLLIRTWSLWVHISSKVRRGRAQFHEEVFNIWKINHWKDDNGNECTNK